MFGDDASVATARGIPRVDLGARKLHDHLKGLGMELMPIASFMEKAMEHFSLKPPAVVVATAQPNHNPKKKDPFLLTVPSFDHDETMRVHVNLLRDNEARYMVCTPHFRAREST